MRRCAFLHLICLGWFAVSSLARAGSEPPPTVPANTADARAVAARHYARGLTFYTQEDYARALAEFEQAYSLTPSPKLLFSMGQTHAGLGQYAAAYRELQTYIDSVADSVPAQRRSQVERQLETLRARLGRVAVSVNVVGATVDVDGDVVGRSPLRAPLMLDVGSHRVGAARVGDSPVAARVSVISGETTAVHLELQPIEDAPKSLATPLWIATGVAAIAAVGTGIIAVEHHRSYERSLELKHSGDPASVHQQLRVERARLRDWLVATDILVGATVVVGAGAIYFSVRASSAGEHSALTRAVGIESGMRGSF